MGRKPGVVSDVILTFMSSTNKPVSIAEIREAVRKQLGEVPSSSVRSYLNLNVPKLFERTGHGVYRLKKR